MCTVCLLLFLCHAYSSYWFPLSPTANRQEKLVAMVDRKVKKGEFRPSGVRPQEVEAVFSSVLEKSATVEFATHIN